MPNWCENDLRIVGEESRISEFLQYVKTERGDLDFNTLIPAGEDCPRDIWGTRSNAEDTTLEQVSDSEIVLTFLTAWSPPEPVVVVASSKFTDLEFKLDYFEAGAGFQGRIEVKAGNIRYEYCKDYDGSRGG
jgi:hypothetical protein